MSRPHAHRPVIRRDADGTELVAPSWESLTERLIREAHEAGAFDDLPHRGGPLRVEDETFAGEMAMAYRVLRNAGAAPPWIEADKEARRIEAEIAALLARSRGLGGPGRDRARRRLVELASEHARVIDRLSVLAPTPRQHRARLDVDALRRRLEDEAPDSRSPG